MNPNQPFDMTGNPNFPRSKYAQNRWQNHWKNLCLLSAKMVGATRPLEDYEIVHRQRVDILRIEGLTTGTIERNGLDDPRISTTDFLAKVGKHRERRKLYLQSRNRKNLGHQGEVNRAVIE